MAPSKTAKAATAVAVNGSRNEQLPGRLNTQNTKIRLQVQFLVRRGIPRLRAELIARLVWGRP
jgi:hypothetical protein